MCLHKLILNFWITKKLLIVTYGCLHLMRIECLYVSKLLIFSTGTLDTMLRSLAIGQLGRYGDPDMIAESHRKFDDHISEKDPIPADYKTAVFSAVLGNGNETHFDKLVEVRVEPLYAICILKILIL